MSTTCGSIEQLITARYQYFAPAIITYGFRSFICEHRAVNNTLTTSYLYKQQSRDVIKADFQTHIILTITVNSSGLQIHNPCTHYLQSSDSRPHIRKKTSDVNHNHRPIKENGQRIISTPRSMDERLAAAREQISYQL